MLTITVHSFITDIINAVDSVIGHFVQNTYQNLIQNNQVTITLIFTFYIMFLGYRFTIHTLSADMTSLVRHLTVMLVVYGLIMDWSIFNTFFYNIFTNEPGSIAQTVVNATGQLTPGDNVGQALNNVFDAGVTTAQKLISEHSIKKFFIGLVVLAFTFLICLVALGFIIYAKMATAIVLALGPIFIIFLLWDSTRSLFEAWLRNLIDFALIPIITVVILALMLSIMSLVLPDLKKIDSDDLGVFNVVMFAGLSLVTVFILKQVFSIASSLSGGITLEALGKAISMAQSALQNEGKAISNSLPAQGIKAGANKIASNVAARRAESRKKAATAAQNKKFDNWV